MASRGSDSPPGPHPLVRVAMELVVQSNGAFAELTPAGQQQLRDALRAAPDRRDAALALLELAVFLAAHDARKTADALGAIVAAEAGNELRALASEASTAADDAKSQAARRIVTGGDRRVEAPARPPDASEVARAGPAARFALQKVVDKDKP